MEKRVNWQACEIKSQKLADDLKGMANEGERFALVKEILDTTISRFIVSNYPRQDNLQKTQ